MLAFGTLKNGTNAVYTRGTGHVPTLLVLKNTTGSAVAVAVSAAGVTVDGDSLAALQRGEVTLKDDAGGDLLAVGDPLTVECDTADAVDFVVFGTKS